MKLLATGGFADLLVLSFVGCFKKCVNRLFHKIGVFDTLYNNYLIKILKKEAKIWVIQKSTVVEEKLAQKKEELEKEIRKNNQYKFL